jgi:hypothetical protein
MPKGRSTSRPSASTTASASRSSTAGSTPTPDSGGSASSPPPSPPDRRAVEPITEVQRDTLLVVARLIHESRTISRWNSPTYVNIAAKTGKAPSTIHGIVQRLIDAGYLTGIPHRSLSLELTDAGASLVARMETEPASKDRENGVG